VSESACARSYRLWSAWVGLGHAIDALTYRLYQVYLSRVDRMAEANQALHSLYERAQADSLTDQLTGLPNRRS